LTVLAMEVGSATAKRLRDYFAENLRLPTVDARLNESAAWEARNHLKLLKASFAGHLQYGHASA